MHDDGGGDGHHENGSHDGMVMMVKIIKMIVGVGMMMKSGLTARMQRCQPYRMVVSNIYHICQ